MWSIMSTDRLYHFIEILLTRQEGDLVGGKVIHGHLPPVCDVENVFVLSIKHTRPRPEQNSVIHEDCSSDLQTESLISCKLHWSPG